MADKTFTTFEALNPYKTFVLEKWTKKRRKVRRQPLQNFVRRRITKDDLEGLKYTQFEQLYELWCDYFGTLTGGCDGRPDDRVLKADYHGCLLMVAEANNVDQVGICGIVVRETRQTFILITKQDRLLTVPKQGTVFLFALKGKIYILFGNAFRFQPSLRAKKILRNRFPIPFFLR